MADRVREAHAGMRVRLRVGRWTTIITLGLALADCAPRPDLPDTRLPQGNELFTIALPADALRDTIPRFGIDQTSSDPNARGTWLGRDWRLDWWWWREVRVAGSAHRGETTMTTRRLSDQDSSLFVTRARWYHWRRQLLRVNFEQHEPSDSIAAERLLASVKFEPKPPWR